MKPALDSDSEEETGAQRKFQSRTGKSWVQDPKCGGASTPRHSDGNCGNVSPVESLRVEVSGGLDNRSASKRRISTELPETFGR
jgi:hypothetical protein